MPLIEKAVANHMAAVEFLQTIEGAKGTDALRAQVKKHVVSSAKALIRETGSVASLGGGTF
jgi:hypothetical protein